MLERLEDRAVPSGGLLSWWTGNDTAADVLGKNDGTLNGGAGYTPGVIGDAFQFNGVDGYFQAPTNNLPTGNQDRTLDLWVKADAFVAPEAFLGGYGAFGSGNQTYQLGLLGSTLFFSQWGNAVFGPSLNTGTWYNVAVTNVGNFVTLYLNGQVVATGNLTIDTPASTQFYMGRIPGGLGDARRLDGEVDEARVFGRALNPSEISAIYQSDFLRSQAPAPSSNGLVAVNPTSIVASGVTQSGAQVPISPVSGTLVLPAYVTSPLAVNPATPAVDAPANSVSALWERSAAISAMDLDAPFSWAADPWKVLAVG